MTDSFRFFRLPAMATALLALGVSAFADQPFTASPLGPQKVLVIPVENPVGNPCPNTKETCPAGLTTWYSQYIELVPLGRIFAQERV